MKKAELLIPSKGIEELRTAVNYGADAVYIGGESMSLRAGAKNFSPEEMSEGIEFAHKRGCKVYVTANILAHNEDLAEAERYFRELREIRPDAILVADPGMFSLAKEICPDIDLHISTQANNTNYRTFRFWEKMGATRVVSARELSLEEIKEIRSKIGDSLEIESFVHGAMCISYSGRCLLSNYFTGHDANHGECKHPCRWKYAVSEVSRPGVYLPIEENDRGTFIFNSKDLCMLEYIPELIAAGVNSLKIEGRMKTALYVAATARTYRKALDDYYESEEKYRENIPWYLEEIKKCTTRDFCTGFWFGKPDYESQIYSNNTYSTEYTYIGSVAEVNDQAEAIFSQKNKFSRGEKIEIMKTDGRNIEARVLSIRTDETPDMPSAPHPKQKLYVRFSETPEVYDILRRREEL